MSDYRLTVPEAAAILRCSTRTVRRRVAEYTIPAVKLPTGGLRFDEAELRAWVAKYRRAPTAELMARAAS